MKTTTTYRQKNGGWQIIVSWKDENGAWHQKSKQGFPRKTDAKEAEAGIIAAIKKQPRPVDPGMKNITLEKFCEEYLANKPSIVFSTKKGYRHAVKSLKSLAKRPVDSITYLDLQSAVRNWDMKPGTQKMYRDKLTVLFGAAVKPYRLISDNPMEDIEIASSREPKTIQTLSQKQYDQILSKIKKEDVMIALAIAWHTGMRRGEIAALSWNEIDFAGKTVTVKRQLTRATKNKMEIVDNTKSKNGVRIIPVPKELLSVLKQYRNSNPVRLDRQVFASPYLTYTRMWQTIRKYGTHPHAFRHTYATRLLANGVDVQTVAALLGDSVQTVINTYIHYTDEMRKAAAKDIQKIFSVNF